MKRGFIVVAESPQFVYTVCADCYLTAITYTYADWKGVPKPEACKVCYPPPSRRIKP